jgi:tetratricopeptide (TPR) repeat protein
MKCFSIRRVIILWCSLALVAGLSVEALSQPCQQWMGKMVSVQGTVEARKAGDTQWLPVNLNDTFCPGDTIRVGSKSRADLTLSNQSVLRLDENSEFTLEGLKEESAAHLNMLKGAAHFFSRTPRGVEVQTPYTIAGVRGTEFMIRIEEGRTLLTVYEGAVLAQNPAGSLTLQSGQSAVAEAGKAPVLRTVARPRDAVQWALYYPPVIYSSPGAATLPANDPQLLAQQASRLLTVGRVEEASAEIERALSLDPKASDALALQTIILIVQNQKEKALETAERAVSAAPNSATARIALSYAQQARFDLEAARASLEEAVKLDPANALAWARLSEMHMSFGYLDRALDAAKQAVAADPKLSRTQTVLGFAYLAQVETRQAREAFDQAISFDQADPLPRLGMGLAIIRDGNLEEGGRQIEIAASLDPNNSIIRSYLGKTYYEEKRIGLDQREYAIAKELDPKDPTPYFYDAIAKQTTNRPVEALQDYQKAIELNDNRAVYRSKLNLDSDEAARQSALARIYSDLGFQQLALVEGWKSVNTDPTNYSAHRFLADSYSILPRHEIARVSELLQSQLLQPTNITPIQPSLAQSNLFLLNAQGPTSLSFNEFNPIFNRNRLAAQGSGLYGSDDTWTGEGIVSGIYNKFSFSGGYTYFDTDGWHDNAYQTDKIADIFAQYELTYKTSIQAEYRYRDTEKGDIQQQFFKTNIDPNEENTDKTDFLRLGFRHAFSPASILIGNFSYQDADSTYSTVPFPGFWDLFKIKANEDAYGSELQHLFRSQYISLRSGAGYFSTDLTEREKSQTIFDPSPITTKTKSDIDHTNLYLYTYIYPLKNLTLTVGASGDFFNKDDKNSDDWDIDENQFNPKFGVQWTPFDGTTLRGAVFRTFKRTLITDQTLEPTQVAGFNQFYDDFNATKTWVYGGAVDQKFSQKFFGGASFTYRELDVPWQFEDFGTGERDIQNANWKEKVFRAYLFWTPHDWFSLTAEWLYEKFDRDEEFGYGIQELKTNYYPLGINFFHPSGISAGFKATYIDQEGKFEQATVVSDDDNFWVLDAAINYRLPKRYGFVTVGVSNLLDEKFNYYDTDPDNPWIRPERFAFIKLTLALP